MVQMDVEGISGLATGALPSLGGQGSSQPSWSRSLHELKAANEALLRGQPQRPSTAAQSLLGTHRPDFGRMFTGTETSKKQKVEQFVGVEDLARRRRDSILERIVNRERDLTEQKLRKRTEKQLQDDWDKKRDRWLDEIVGSRTLGGSATSNNRHKMTDNNNIRNGVPLVGLRDNNHLFVGKGQGSSNNTELIPQTVKSHLDITNLIGENLQLPEAMLQFHKIPISGSPQDACYSIGWQLLYSMLPRAASPVESAVGALIHFCKQFRHLAMNRVRTANSAGQDTTTQTRYQAGSTAATIASYLKLQYGNNSSLWHMIYFCLRCGDAVAASQALDTPSTHHTEVEQIVRNVLNAMSQGQAGSSCLWERSTPLISPADRQTIADLFERTKNLEPDNIYKIGSLALLCGIKSIPSSEAEGFRTIEDYLFGALWQAVQSRDPQTEIKNISARIHKFGPKYFGDEETGGWSYSLPLLATQQYETALSFLADRGGATGLLQATHLALVISTAGIPLYDFGRPEPQGCLLTELLVAYAAVLQNVFPEEYMASLQYLRKIPSKSRSREEIASFLSRNTSNERLIGRLSAEGIRQNSALEQFMEPAEVDLVLADAAEILRKQARDRGKAQASALLYTLAGRYVSVLVFLTEMMSPPHSMDDDKRFWCQQSEAFQNAFLNKRTYVLERLEREGRLDLVESNRTMMEFRRFFEDLSMGNFMKAWEDVNKLNVLPVSESDLAAKSTKYQELEPILKESFPALLRGAAESLYLQYRQVKFENRGTTPTAELRLDELRQMVRLLHTFAGLFNFPHEMRNSISEFVGLMV